MRTVNPDDVLILGEWVPMPLQDTASHWTPIEINLHLGLGLPIATCKAGELRGYDWFDKPPCPFERKQVRTHVHTHLCGVCHSSTAYHPRKSAAFKEPSPCPFNKNTIPNSLISPTSQARETNVSKHTQPNNHRPSTRSGMHLRCRWSPHQLRRHLHRNLQQHSPRVWQTRLFLERESKAAKPGLGGKIFTNPVH